MILGSSDIGTTLPLFKQNVLTFMCFNFMVNVPCVPSTAPLFELAEQGKIYQDAPAISWDLYKLLKSAWRALGIKQVFLPFRLFEGFNTDPFLSKS